MSIVGNKRIMYDWVKAINFAKAFCKHYNYEFKKDVTVSFNLEKRIVTVPNEAELAEFIEMVQAGEIQRSW